MHGYPDIAESLHAVRVIVSREHLWQLFVWLQVSIHVVDLQADVCATCQMIELKFDVFHVNIVRCTCQSLCYLCCVWQPSLNGDMRTDKPLFSKVLSVWGEFLFCVAH